MEFPRKFMNNLNREQTLEMNVLNILSSPLSPSKKGGVGVADFV
jgi:hypothetical protein